MIPEPKGKAPISRDVVEVVKRKIAPPSSPPPPGMKSLFNAPKSYSSSTYSNVKFRNEEGIDDFYAYSDEEENSDEFYDQDGELIDENETIDKNRKSKYLEPKGKNNVRFDDEKSNTDSNYQYKSDTKQHIDEKLPIKQEQKMQNHFDQNKKPGNNLTKPVVFNFQPLLKATFRELKNFVMSPCPPGIVVRCYIERNRSGTHMFSPFYSICADLEGIISFYVGFRIICIFHFYLFETKP